MNELLMKAKPVLVPIKRLIDRVLRSQTIIGFLVFNYHKSRFKKFSGAFNNSKSKDLAYLTWLYHVVEKGLAMPEMRLGFGVEKLVELNLVIFRFIDLHDKNDCAVKDAVSVVFEYERVHALANFRLSDSLTHIIRNLHIQFPDIKPINQLVISRDEYFANTDGAFPLFSKSRHSIRDFAGSVELEKIIASIDTAITAPSACNRQPWRVHIIVDKAKISQCLAMQNGNRGFGHLADKLLIVTGDLSTVLGPQEFFDLNTNVGIFIMNLSYSLHYNRIAHCILNWYSLPQTDKKLRRIVTIGRAENVAAFIACGGLPDKVKIVVSPRQCATEIYTIH